MLLLYDEYDLYWFVNVICIIIRVVDILNYFFNYKIFELNVLWLKSVWLINEEIEENLECILKKFEFIK